MGFGNPTCPYCRHEFNGPHECQPHPAPAEAIGIGRAEVRKLQADMERDDASTVPAASEPLGPWGKLPKLEDYISLEEVEARFGEWKTKYEALERDRDSWERAYETVCERETRIEAERDKLRSELKTAMSEWKAEHNSFEAERERRLKAELAEANEVRAALRVSCDVFKAQAEELAGALVTIECGMVTTAETAQYAGFKPKEIATLALKRYREGKK